MDSIASMAKMNTTQEIATIIASIADGKATFDEADILSRYSGAEMDEYYAWLEAA
jgi:hypothetical protein